MSLHIKKAPKGESDYAHHLSSKPIVANTIVEHKKAGEEYQMAQEKEEVLNPGIMGTPNQMCMVTVEGSHTVNLGNYESARIGVSLRVPSTVDDLQDTYEWATTWVGEKIGKAVAEAKGV